VPPEELQMEKGKIVTFSLLFAYLVESSKNGGRKKAGLGNS